MTCLERLEEAIENRDALWVLYMIAERERILTLLIESDIRTRAIVFNRSLTPASTTIMLVAIISAVTNIIVIIRNLTITIALRTTIYKGAVKDLLYPSITIAKFTIHFFSSC